MHENIRTFKAATVEDALAQIRREMGLDAIVVETKRVQRRSLFPWVASQQGVEVKAARVSAQRRAQAGRQSSDTRTLAAQSTTPRTIAGTKAHARLAAASGQSSHSATASATTEVTRPRSPLSASLAPPPALLDECAEASIQADMAIIAPREEPFTGGPLAPEGSSRGAMMATLKTSPIVTDSRQLSDIKLSGPVRNRIAASINPTAELPVRRTPVASHVARGSLTPETSLSNLGNAHIGTETQAVPSDIEQRLDSLQKMIAELGRRTRPRGLIEIPPELFAYYLTLIEADVDDEIARDLIAKLQQHAAPGQLGDTAAATSLLAALIEREIRCAEPIAPKRGCRQVAMLVGPTGVGKTTTIAKLAGRFGVSHGLRVGLITVDTYRVAAVDQLRTYAEIIDLPMQVVSAPEELPAALAMFAEFDLVLIDTAGRSPHDDRRLEELKQLVDAAAPDHVYLVLSLACGAKPLRAAAERFAAVRPTSLILTKLDEAAGCGSLLSATRDIVLPVTYLTVGQEVPRDIEPANPCRIARLILGRDRLISAAP